LGACLWDVGFDGVGITWVEALCERRILSVLMTGMGLEHRVTRWVPRMGLMVVVECDRERSGEGYDVEEVLPSRR
jgi:hypothetical protein